MLTKKPKEWKKSEIRKARQIVNNYNKWLGNQYRALKFDISEDSVVCNIIDVRLADSKNPISFREEKITCSKSDVFNAEIWMCIAACRILDTPIPDFILNK